ncbi:Retrovirus-related Pol polyprotein from transposon RE1-like protein, partial [Drosera capensis]
WVVRQLDIKNAFLHGHLTEEVYMRQPSGFIYLTLSSHVCRLHKALYDLRQAFRAWIHRFTCRNLPVSYISLSFLMCVAYIRHCMVFDKLFVPSFIGLAVFFSIVASHRLSLTAPCLSIVVIPKSCYSMLMISLSPAVLIHFCPHSSRTPYSYGSLPISKKTRIGPVVRIVHVPLQKQPTVSKSSTEAEYRAFTYMVADTLWIRCLLAELGFPLVKPVRLFYDNVSASYLALNQVLHARNKHVAVDYHGVWERVSHKDLIVHYVPTHLQLADIFTKALSSDRFEFLRSNFGVDLPAQIEGDNRIMTSKDVKSSLHNYY